MTIAIRPPFDPYAVWKCSSCKRKLLVPALAIRIPGHCPCGEPHPFRLEAVSWPLEPVATSAVGDDPYLVDNLLGTYRAAKRYEYDVRASDSCSYEVTNPINTRTYHIVIDKPGRDDCDCDGFKLGLGTCLHIEHVRWKLKLPSSSEEFLKQSSFAYAWFDKSSLPPRIRIGWMGPRNAKVQRIFAGIKPIRSLNELNAIKKRFCSATIPFRILHSASFAFGENNGLPVQPDLAELIHRLGENHLSKKIPALRPYQVTGALFLASAQRCLLLDEMGLGKTCQAIAAACLLQEFARIRSCLIIAPKSVIPHWAAEVRRFADQECILINGGESRRNELYCHRTVFKAVTLESFRKDFPNCGQHDLVIFDEVHKLRDLGTVSNRLFRGFSTRFFFGLSGTAIEKGLEDLYGILCAIRCPMLESPLEFLASHIICDRFGNKAYAINPEFFAIRYNAHILRRLKSEVERDLPPLSTEEVNLELTSTQEGMAAPMLKELKALKERLETRFDPDDLQRQRWLINRIVELSDCTSLIDPTTSSSPKLEWLQEYLRVKCLEENEKVVIFTRWVRVQQLICGVCSRLGIEHETLSGEDSDEQRINAISRFVSSSNVRAFVSTDAGGVGINLQAARIVVNFEPAWNPSTNEQRIQRVHRIGQTRPVTAVYLLTCLDLSFVMQTYVRKWLPASRIDDARKHAGNDSMPTWQELAGVIKCFRDLANNSKALRSTISMQRFKDDGLEQL